MNEGSSVRRSVVGGHEYSCGGRISPQSGSRNLLWLASGLCEVGVGVLIVGRTCGGNLEVQRIPEVRGWTYIQENHEWRETSKGATRYRKP